MGNTISLWLNGSSRPVHPHMHGEYTYSASLKPRLTGSPPHAWGIPTLPIRNNSVTRFTPTCMGNTNIPCVTIRFGSVHPHMHGEYIVDLIVAPIEGGSPPHAWGIPAAHNYAHGDRRFTPTCMGNTHRFWRMVIFSTVHPHMHGEYPNCTLSRRTNSGSPPHAWGIHLINRGLRGH